MKKRKKHFHLNKSLGKHLNKHKKHFHGAMAGVLLLALMLSGTFFPLKPARAATFTPQ